MKAVIEAKRRRSTGLATAYSDNVGKDGEQAACTTMEGTTTSTHDKA